jgi:hypothetical protein
LSFPGLQTLSLVLFWGLGISPVSAGAFSQERPMRLHCPIVPMVLLIVVDLSLNPPPG